MDVEKIAICARNNSLDDGKKTESRWINRQCLCSVWLKPVFTESSAKEQYTKIRQPIK